jgi:hemerythrin
MTLEWTSGLRVGVDEIDEQHQELFRRAERLILSLRAGDRGEVEPLLHYLQDYVTSHFDCEERWMTTAEYPGLEAHRDAHRRFRDEFAGMVRDYQRLGPTPLVALGVHDWLADWLTQHIGGADVALARWLKDRGVALGG